VLERLQTEFGLVIGFNEHFQMVIASNYSTIANLHTLQFATAGTKFFLVYCIFTGCRLVTAFNAVDFSASVFTSLVTGDYLTTHSLL
jgi:hypothetical protein